MLELAGATEEDKHGELGGAEDKMLGEGLAEDVIARPMRFDTKRLPC